MKNFVVLVALVFVSAFAHAQSVTGVVSSKYILSNGVAIHDGPGVQIDGTKSWRGYYVNLWGYRSFDGAFTEIDGTVGWTNKYIDLNAGYFDIEPLGKQGDVVQVSAKFSVPKKFGDHELSGYVVIDYIIPRQDFDKNKGEFVRAGLSAALVLSPRTTIRETTYLLYDNGVFRGEKGFIGRYEVSVGMKRGAYTFEPGVRISVPFVSDRETQIVAILKVSR